MTNKDLYSPLTGKVKAGYVSCREKFFMIKIMPKIITLLELFASGGDFAFSEIVVRTGLTRSNVSHLLQSMCECGMLKKEEYGKYRRGERLLRLCLSIIRLPLRCHRQREFALLIIHCWLRRHLPATDRYS